MQGMPIHMDGARVFNAAAALGVPVADIAAKATSVSFCLSKGLGAPVGSLVAGPCAFIERVFHMRKLLGGGLRQAGVIAAPGARSHARTLHRSRCSRCRHHPQTCRDGCRGAHLQASWR